MRAKIDHGTQDERGGSSHTDPKAFNLQVIGRQSLDIYPRGLAPGATSAASAVRMTTPATAH